MGFQAAGPVELGSGSSPDHQLFLPGVLGFGSVTFTVFVFCAYDFLLACAHNVASLKAGHHDFVSDLDPQEECLSWW